MKGEKGEEMKQRVGEWRECRKWRREEMMKKIGKEEDKYGYSLHCFEYAPPPISVAVLYPI